MSCQAFEGINRPVKEQLEDHSNGHYGQGLEDNMVSGALNALYLKKIVDRDINLQQDNHEEQCSACKSCNAGTGDIPGEGGRCLRFPDCKDCTWMVEHTRRSCIGCPHNMRYQVRYTSGSD